MKTIRTDTTRSYLHGLVLAVLSSFLRLKPQQAHPFLFSDSRHIRARFDRGSQTEFESTRERGAMAYWATIRRHRLLASSCACLEGLSLVTFFFFLCHSMAVVSSSAVVFLPFEIHSGAGSIVIREGEPSKSPRTPSIQRHASSALVFGLLALPAKARARHLWPTPRTA